MALKTLPYIETITLNLFEAETRRLDSVISSLNQRNKRLSDCKVQGYPVDGFLHAGIFYLPRDATVRSGSGIAKTPLHSSLQDEMIRFLNDRTIVDLDKLFIKQVIHTLLSLCRSEQEMRDALPECLIGCYPSFAQLSRRDEPAHSIRNNPRALRQYEKFLPKMEFYSAAKLLY